jgi:hypothetical protein
MSLGWTPSIPRVDRHDSCLRPYRGPSAELSDEDLRYFKGKYQIPTVWAYSCIRRGNGGRYLLPIFSPRGECRGHVSRIPWPDAPLKCTERLPKADTFRSAWGPVQSHYRSFPSRHAANIIVLVEDQLSAIKLAAHGYDSVALLGKPVSLVGTYGGADRVAEIAKRARTADEVLVALDSDATDDAFKFARKWGAAFKRCRVAILSSDLKDTPADDFAEVLGV